LTGSPEVAEDLLQDVCVRFLAADPPTMTERETVSYLYTIATRLTWDRWRRARVERDWERALPPPDPVQPDPAGARRDVEAALAEIRPRDRALLWLAHVEGRPHREIADIVGIAPGSVRVLLFRARRRLARVLAERGLTPEGS